MNSAITVRSSHGCMTVDAEGRIAAIEPDTTDNPLRRIERCIVPFRRHAPGQVDILHCRIEYADGSVAEPLRGLPPWMPDLTAEEVRGIIEAIAPPGGDCAIIGGGSDERRD